MPKSSTNKLHFKAAQDLVTRNQGSLAYNDEEYELKFKEIARQSQLKQLGNVDDLYYD